MTTLHPTQQAQVSTRRSTGILTALAALLIGASLALAFSGLFIGYSYWFDELISIVATHRSLHAMFVFILSDVHPPLYYLLLHYWTYAFGTGEIAARALSAIFAAGSLAVFARFAARRLHTSAALIAITVFATNWMYAYYAQEARSNAMVLLLATILTAVFIVFIEKRDARALVWLLISALLLTLTHYFGLIYAGIILIAALYHARRAWRQAAWIVLTGVLCLVWPVIHFVFGALASDTGGDFWIESDGAQTTLSWLSQALMPQINVGAEMWLPMAGAQYLTAATILGVLVLAIWLCSVGLDRWRAERPAARRALASILGVLIAMLLVVTVIDYRSPISNDRNFIVLLPATALLLGWAAGDLSCDRYRRTLATAFVVLFCGSSLAGSWQKILWKQQPMENVRAAAGFVAERQGSVYALVETQKQAELYRDIAAFYMPPNRKVRVITPRRFGTLTPPYFVFSQHKAEEARRLARKWNTRVFTPEQKSTQGVQVLYALKSSWAGAGQSTQGKSTPQPIADRVTAAALRKNAL